VIRPLRPAIAPRSRIAVCAVVAATLVAVASGCGSSSSGGQKASPGNLLAAALQLQQQGKLNAAKQLYEQVVQAQPDNYYAHYDLGVIAQQAGDDTGALADYGAALTANPKYVPALYNEATIYAKTDPALAITTYRQVLAIQPVAPTAALNLGLLEFAHGQRQQGLHDLGIAITQDSSLLAQIPKHLQHLVQAATSSSTSSPSSGATTSSTPTTSPS